MKTESLDQHQIFKQSWAEFLFRTGERIATLESDNATKNLRLALVLPKIGFSESLIAAGYLVNKFRFEIKQRELSEVVNYWSRRVGERASLIYRVGAKTCLRNGKIVNDADSPVGLGLELEGGICDEVKKSLRESQVNLLSAPLDEDYTTTSHARSECAHSVGFLTKFFGSEELALSFLLGRDVVLHIDSTSQTRLRNEGRQNLEVGGQKLRMEDLLRFGHPQESLPPNVLWGPDKSEEYEGLFSICGGKKAILDRLRSRTTSPMLFLLERGDSGQEEVSERIKSLFLNRSSEDCSEIFSRDESGRAEDGIELVAWR